MKTLLLTFSLFFISSLQAKLNESCHLKNSTGKQKHYICNIKNKNVHFLDIHGSMKDVAFYHGKFLETEVKDGVIKAVKKRKDESFAALSSSERKTYETVFKCVKSRYKRSLNKDFIEELEMLAKGANISKAEVIESTLMIEMSSFIDALDVKMKKNSKKATLELISQCGLRLAGSSVKGFIKKLTKPFRKIKMGCTGFVAGGEYTQGDEFLHGRNFDTGFLGVFEKYPVILRHTPNKGIPYIGMSSAGLHYSGGITGMNAKGISVSSHELRTTKVRTLYSNRSGIIAPYMANLIVKEASTLDEAIKLIKSHGHFGAWTFLISDSKTGESASVEVSGKIVRVAKRSFNKLSQANHFRHPDTAKFNFEYSINKSLESRARIEHVNLGLESSKGSIDSQWGIDLLSGHIDHYMGLRTFGRTVSKVYTSMSHVLDSKNNQLWFSLGESFPTNYSTFLGIEIDFKTKSKFFNFIDAVKTKQSFREQYPFFEEILRNYTLAYMNDRDFGQSVENLKATRRILKDSLKVSDDNSFFDFSTTIMHARLGLKLFAKSRDQLVLLEVKNDLESITALQLKRLHEYERSQVFRDLAIVEDLSGNRELAKELYSKSLFEMEKLTREFPAHHFMWVYIAELKVFKKRGITIWDTQNLDLHFATAE